MTRSRRTPGPDPEAWEAVAVTRHGERPTSTYYIRNILDQFFEFHGDRLSGDDGSIVTGIGYLFDRPVIAIGQQRPYSLHGANYHVNPDGLRKAQKIVKLASRFRLPVVTFIGYPGSRPGPGCGGAWYRQRHRNYPLHDAGSADPDCRRNHWGGR